MKTIGKSEYSVIKPTSFYSNEREKTKLNWFCYEFAVGVHDRITKDFGKRLKRYRIDEKTIAGFSIYVSKTMKESILLKLSGRIDKICFSYEMITSYFPNLNDRLVDQMLDAIAKVWDDQLSFCEVCPARCISEKYAYCSLFDDETIHL
ncbi:MAG: hypothetical protein U9N07_01175 [Euryarchaeota archaeon]|nr:hypothetical protein [Euryarchaeota archaeon]